MTPPSSHCGQARFLAHVVADYSGLRPACSAAALLGGAGQYPLDPRQMRRQFAPSGMLPLAGPAHIALFSFGAIRFGLYLPGAHSGLALQQFELPVAKLLAFRPVLLDPHEPNLLLE